MLYILFYRRRSTLDDSEPRAAQGQGQMQQQIVPVQDSYMQNRADALQNVESTIVELSNIFSQLATMVAQQGEMAIRFDNLKFKACHFFFPGIQPVH
jgi:syntaxin 5